MLFCSNGDINLKKKNCDMSPNALVTFPQFLKFKMLKSSINIFLMCTKVKYINIHNKVSLYYELEVPSKYILENILFCCFCTESSIQIDQFLRLHKVKKFKTRPWKEKLTASLR